MWRGCSSLVSWLSPVLIRTGLAWCWMLDHLAYLLFIQRKLNLSVCWFVKLSSLVCRGVWQSNGERWRLDWQSESRLCLCNEYKWAPGLTLLVWLAPLKTGMCVRWRRPPPSAYTALYILCVFMNLHWIVSMQLHLYTKIHNLMQLNESRHESLAV